MGSASKLLLCTVPPIAGLAPGSGVSLLFCNIIPGGENPPGIFFGNSQIPCLVLLFVGVREVKPWLRGAPRRVSLTEGLQVVYVEGDNSDLQSGSPSAQRVRGVGYPIEVGRKADQG